MFVAPAPPAEAAPAPRHIPSLEGLELEAGPTGVQRLKYQKQGWQFWDWSDAETGIHKIHYVSAGLNNPGPTVLLIHGFGASAFHWRHQIPALVNAGHRVFAVDLLGFGWSDKALVTYDGYSVWTRQLSSFIRDVVKQQCILVGNSLGGYNSLATAANCPELVSGVALLNGAGRFDDLDESAAQQSQDVVELDAVEAPGQPVQQSPDKEIAAAAAQPGFLDNALAAAQGVARRVGLYFAFIYAKQPARIKQVLCNVYIDDSNVDEALVDSIIQPAQDSNAAECFRLILSGSGTSLNRLLRRMQAPLLLCWGDLDPWIGPRSADRVMELYPSAVRVRLQSGHCPHDESPAAVNSALISWLATLEKPSEA